MYSIKEKRTRSELANALENLALSGEANANLSAEVAAEILDCGWAAGGLAGPMLMIKGSTLTDRSDVNILTSFDTGIRIAARLEIPLADTLMSVAINLSRWTDDGNLAERDAAPIVLAWILLNGGKEEQ